MKPTIKDIIEALKGVKTLENATLEEMATEIHATSTCVVVDSDDIKKAGRGIEIHNGKILTFIDGIARADHKIECSFRQFISQNVEAAWQGETADQFVKDARMLAGMLVRAANRIERELNAEA